MALVLKDRVKETSTSTGTGSFVLAGAATGFQSFASALADGDTTYYAIEDGTDWETGLGTWTEATSTLARTTVYESSNSGNAVDWGAGSKNVFITQPASRTATIAVYPTIDDLPLTGNVQAGDQAYVSDNNRLYLYNGSGWFNIALVNQTPTISGNEASYALANDGTPTVVTLTGADPEGIPITWSHVATGLTNEATISNVDNVFTITPSTDSANQGDFSVTFRASDGVNIGTAASEFTLVFVSALFKDANLSIGTSATNGLDNSTFIDRSTNAHTVTPTGSPVQTAFHPYLDNWSVEFDGSDDYLSLADNTEFEFDADFTVELWVYRTSETAETYQAIVGGNGSGVNGWHIYLNNSTGQLLWYYSSFPAQTATYVAFNEWTHIAVSRSGSNLNIFKNGELTSTIGSYTTNLVNSTSGIRIGYGIGANGYWAGNISNLRIVKGTALYTANFTPPTEKLTAVSGTTLLACQSNRCIDNSASGHAITVTGNPVVSAFNPFGQESEYAAGENKGSVKFADSDSVYLSATSNDFAFGTGSFTVEGWYYKTSNSNTDTIVGTRTSTSDTTGWSFVHNTSNYLGIYTSAYQVQSSVAVPLNQWYHFAITYDGTTLRLFKDGQILDTGTQTQNLSKNVLYMGATPAQAQPSSGYLSELKIVKGTALYTSAFTPPTAPVGNTSASLYLPMDNAGVYDKTGNATLVPNTSTATSTTQTKYATTSINFPANSTLSALYEPWMNISDQNFTMEMWVYPTDSSGGTLWSLGYSGDNRLDFGWQSSGGIRLLIETSNVSNTVFTSSDAVSTYLNSWVHIAVVRVGTGFTLYVNGTSTATGTSSLPIVEDTTDGWLFGGREFSSDYTGGNPSDAFTGYLENIQFFKGLAKYTSNFTVPSQEQGRTYQAES